MTYMPKKGNFLIGFRTGSIQVPSTATQVNDGSVEFQAFYTTEGEQNGSLRVSGLAFSDSRSDSNIGLSPLMSTSPKSDGAFGTDIPENYKSIACAASQGCGVYSDETIYLYYYNYDRDRILRDSFVICYGEVT